MKEDRRPRKRWNPGPLPNLKENMKTHTHTCIYCNTTWLCHRPNICDSLQCHEYDTCEYKSCAKAQLKCQQQGKSICDKCFDEMFKEVK